MTINISRRTALAIGGVSLTLLSKQRSVRAAERSDVIVIGAGFSGLNTAMILADEGARVTVLESSNRIGGRAYTGDHIDGRLELGANQIGPFYARVIDVAERLGVRLIPGANVNAPFAFSINGTLISPDEWESSPHNKLNEQERHLLPSALQPYYMINHNPLVELDEWLEDKGRPFDIPYGRWLQSIGASPQALKFIGETAIGEDIWRVPALRYIQDSTRAATMMADLKGDPTKSGYEMAALKSARVEGRTSRLPEAMAQYLGDSVRRNKIVTRISMNKIRAEVHCLDGSRYEADFVVSAVPFPALRNIEVEPGFEGPQKTAVNRMPYKNNSQVYLQLKGSPFWEQDGFNASLWTDGPLNMIRLPLSPDGRRDRLSVITVGKKADRLDQLKPEDRGAFVIKEIERLRPSIKDKLSIAGMHSWRQASFNLGCSHSFDAGDVTAYAREMIRPHERLHSAGEHTRRLEVGMESAMESGERVAFGILELIS